ncbi:MAG: tRNA (adenosine(37)-N6)-dimethylallyltransferase MiaA [Dehalococcoidia bacterium]|jgi:tRNA dimethylallyltransferase|nr:tRNA (adenosine(37)-N6)-dimethylallyltransferase MiaA [Dehalococcoidia bacterium]
MSQRVIAVVGPTAVGKTGLSVALAQAIGGEVLNVDSRQVYRGMDIGTGKPSGAVRRLVPHHLFNLVDPDEDFSLAYYLDEARASVNQVHGLDHPTILVGGTGQYLWALIEGWAVPQVPPDRELRALLAEEAERDGAPALHGKLESFDPSAAASIDQNNVRRVVRALEVIEATGRPFSEQRTAEPPKWDVTIIGLTVDQPRLDLKIRNRVETQMEEGWPGEVQGLLDRGYRVDLPSFGSLGYRDVAAHVSGDLTSEEVIERVYTSTRRFARRQYAWFGLDDTRINWLEVTESTDVLTSALTVIGNAGRAP